MEGYRRSALPQQALPVADECWVVNRLGGTDRERLARLLEELDRLGSSDPSLLADPEARLPAEPLSSRVRQASATRMLAILSREPAGLIAAVLRMESWPWEASFLAGLDPALRNRVTAAMRKDSRISEKLADSLRSGLEARLGAVAAPRERSGRLRKLGAWSLGRVRRARDVISSTLTRRNR